MRRRFSAQTIVALLFLSTLFAMRADAAQTVGLFKHDPPAFEGYTLFGPAQSNRVFLINNDGLPVHVWNTGVGPGLMGYLRPNGNLLRAARIIGGPVGASAAVREYDWDGNVVWDYTFNTTSSQPHHDIKPMPNGNVIVVSWQFKTMAEAIAAGRNPAQVTTAGVWPDMIIEVQPTGLTTGNIVWEWHAWDHLVQHFDSSKPNYGVVSDHPELIDLNFGGSGQDWHHVNAVAYNAELDQIIISSRSFSEFWVVDHGTTTAEAAGHTGGLRGRGGDLLYRWGNPATYQRGTSVDQKSFFQHDVQWIDPGLPGAGHILFFNNGVTGANQHSTVDEIVPPLLPNGTYDILPGQPYGPAGPLWQYGGTPPGSFFSSLISGAQRQPNGNTVIDEGNPGHFFEVTNDKVKVWDYVNPIGGGDVPTNQGTAPSLNLVFKVRRYPADAPMFAGKDLTPGAPLEVVGEKPASVDNDSLTASRQNVSGSQLRVFFTPANCTSSNYNLLYGDLSNVATATLAGAECNIGTGAPYAWNPAPAGSLFFLIVGRDPTAIYESSWGQTSAGAERHGTTSSFQCGATTKILTPACF